MSRKRVQEACHCYICAGKLRDPCTVRDHLRRRRLQAVPPSGENLNVDVIDVSHPEEEVITDQSIRVVEAYDSFFESELLHSLDPDPLFPTADAAAAPSAVHVIVMHLNWLNSFDVSMNAAKHMWDVLRAMLPAERGDPLGTFARIQKFVRKYRLMTAETIDICPCGETIYKDFDDPVIKAKYWWCEDRRRSCLRCSLPRHVIDPETGIEKSAAVVYYLPFGFARACVMV